MRYIIFFLLNFAPMALCLELELPGWEKQIKNDTVTQTVVVYSKSFEIHGKRLRTSILHVRNNDKWHWQQSFHLLGNERRSDLIAQNMVVNNGPDVQEWSFGSHQEISTMAIGKADRNKYGLIKNGEKFMSIIFKDRGLNDEYKSVVFVANQSGIFMLRSKDGIETTSDF